MNTQSPRQLALVGAVVLSALASCGSPSLPPLATESCVIGWWHGPATSCDLYCPNQPECSASDCQVFDYMGLQADKQNISGVITLSMGARRMSSAGPKDVSTWMLEKEGSLILRTGGQSVEARCGGDRLDLGLATQQRYASEISAVLEAKKDVTKFSSEAF